MNENSSQIRKSIIDYLELMSSNQKLLEYPCTPEWVCIFADDLFHPKSKAFMDAFTDDEYRDLAEYYGRLCVASDVLPSEGEMSIPKILALPEWVSLRKFAKSLLERLEKNA